MKQRQIKGNTNLSKTPDALDRRIAQLLIENPATTDAALATNLGISRMAANRRRHGAGVQGLLSEGLTLPIKELKRLMTKSARKLEQLIDDKDKRIALTAAIQMFRLSILAQESLPPPEQDNNLDVIISWIDELEKANDGAA